MAPHDCLKGMSQCTHGVMSPSESRGLGVIRPRCGPSALSHSASWMRRPAVPPVPVSKHALKKIEPRRLWVDQSWFGALRSLDGVLQADLHPSFRRKAPYCAMPSQPPWQRCFFGVGLRGSSLVKRNASHLPTPGTPALFKRAIARVQRLPISLNPSKPGIARA